MTTEACLKEKLSSFDAKFGEIEPVSPPALMVSEQLIDLDKVHIALFSLS